MIFQSLQHKLLEKKEKKTQQTQQTRYNVSINYMSNLKTRHRETTE